MGGNFGVCSFALLYNLCLAYFYDETETRLQNTLAEYCTNKTFLRCPDNSSQNSVIGCCTGCSCLSTCGLSGNCCYKEQDKYNLTESGSLRCMYPDTKGKHTNMGFPMYTFMVGPPINGCHVHGSCHKNQTLIPWQTFYPVYSREKKMNYLNEECARCHGVKDGLKWISRFTMQSIKSMNIIELFHFLQNSNSNEIYLVFEHPGHKLEKSETRCSTSMIQSCMDEDRFEASRISSSTGLSFGELRDGCLFGPNNPFAHNRRLYKNVFCAICGSYIPKEDCSTSVDRFLDGVLTSVIDHTFVEQMSKNGYKRPAMKACKIGTNDECLEAFCPAMQVRDENGRCIFPTENWHFRLAALYINVTFPNLVFNSSTFSNMSESKILETFYKNSPWHACWKIVYIGMRSYVSKDKPMTEAVVHLLCRITEVEPKRLVSIVQKSMSVSWVVYINSKPFSGFQEFLRYPLSHYPTTEGLNLRPSWLKEKHITIGTNEPCPSLRNVTAPSWTVLYDNTVFVGYYIVISKIFFCNQVELKASDYIYDKTCRVVKLTNPDKVLFRLEMYVSKLGPSRVSVCIEDFDMKIVSYDACKGLNLHRMMILIPLVLTELTYFKTIKF